MELNRRTALQSVAATAVVGATGVAATTTAAEAATRPTLSQGDTGWWVANLQKRLNAAGYWTRKTDGVYDDTTQQAVMALQKMRGLTRDGVCGPMTWSAVYSIYRPKARTTSGNIIEVNKGRQVILVVEDGRVKWVFNTSTGNNKRYWSSDGYWAYATTPSGRFKITRAIDGMRVAALGELWRPRYFNGGIAFHGSTSIPGYPASHGCCRMSNKAINYVWWKNLMPIGRAVWVY
ncbi:MULTISPECIES: L,D-transpeptidase family protein [unclassified Janibacter]|uniref:L,D-transpeptidase family protein n=1 Tax=unclassified Janibacter TaxID=2649294 RepID=UPI003D0793DF